MSFDLQRLQAWMGVDKVLSDAPALTAYAIDASLYKITPKAVVLIESKTDLERVLDFARAHHVPLTARSGGTNLTGNAIGEGIILEFSRLNRILEIQPEAGWARVEPGIVYAELNRELSRIGFMFAPDPSSGEMCKLGGMLGNNAAGPHTLKYGGTKDNVLEMEVLLANGHWITARDYSLAEPAFQALLDQNPLLQEVVSLIRQNAALIASKKRAVSKNSSGYNLFALAEGIALGRFPLHQLMIGSEGTLGLTASAKIRLTPRPTEVAVAIIYLDKVNEIASVVKFILKLYPSALEMMDANTLNLIGRQKFHVPEDAEAMLLVEFDQSGRQKMEAMIRGLEGYQLSAPVRVALDPEQQAQFWGVRKAIYPTLYRYDEKKKPINFADDVVVPTDRIAELMVYLDTLFQQKGVKVAIFGHIGDGNAHITPLLDLNDPTDFAKMIALSREIHTTVIEQFGGSLCGEHGDGRVRAEFVEALYGPELYALFCQVKRLFDPEGIFNPGVKITSTPFTEHIDFERFSKPCATCGKCNSVCPVYDVEGEESNAARGWFHIVTDPDYSYEKSSRVVEACINCKSCLAVCPAGIDVSALILKKREEHPNRVAGALFSLQKRQAFFETLVKVAAWTQPVWDRPVGRTLLEYLTLPLLKGLAPTARIPAGMILPKLAKRSLRERYARLCQEDPSPRGQPPRAEVAYFHGCAANYFDDGVGEAVIGVLERQGVSVALPPQRCSGTPIQTYGLIDQVRDNAKFNVNALAPFEQVITGCASCTFMLKDYPNVLTEGEDHEKAKALSGRVRHISEVLLNDFQYRSASQAKEGPRVTYHASCHLRAAGVTHAPRELLRRHFNYVEMPYADRCAGGAGTFCIKNPVQSKAIFERKRRGIEESGAEIVATSCPACMIQLQEGMRGKVTVKHIAQMIHDLR